MGAAGDQVAWAVVATELAGDDMVEGEANTVLLSSSPAVGASEAIPVINRQTGGICYPVVTLSCFASCHLSLPLSDI